MIYIYYAIIPETGIADVYNSCQGIFPEGAELGNQYYFIHDKLASLLGKILLKSCLKRIGRNTDIKDRILLDVNNRPYLSGEGDIDFNISHSGKYVVCAITVNAHIGIDIEQKKNVNLTDFDYVMSGFQWRVIKSAENPLHAFYSFWVKKESVIKADGRGMGIPLEEIYFDENIALFRSHKWFIKEIVFDKEYCMCVSSNIPVNEITIEKLSW